MSFCKCGGYLGSGGVDMYSGRWCRCANPQMIHIPSVTADSVLINNSPKLKSCDNCGEKDARIEELETLVRELRDDHFKEVHWRNTVIGNKYRKIFEGLETKDKE